jgi:hypothetical protein
MRLLTVGDSFTYGEELADPQTSAWPVLLGNKLGYEVTNLAKPGSGNTRMVRHVVEQVGRFEMADEAGCYDIWPGCNNKAQYKLNSSWRWDQIDYFSRHHDDYYLYRQYLTNILLLQGFLTAHKKRYVMMDTFGNNYDPNLTISMLREKNLDLMNKVHRRYFIGWPEETMMEWTYGCQQGEKGHFLEDGHTVIAEKIVKFMEQATWDY